MSRVGLLSLRGFVRASVSDNIMFVVITIGEQSCSTHSSTHGRTILTYSATVLRTVCLLTDASYRTPHHAWH